MTSTMNIPASIGMSVSEIDTPALIIELDTVEENIRRMAHYCRQHSIALRPHAKTHKSIHLAQLQVEMGAVGICCQKVSEAEVFVDGGINDILISNQVVGPNKINRLIGIVQRANVAVCVDNPAHISELEISARAHNTVVDVLVEVDVGGKRCGVQPGRATLELARMVKLAEHLRFKGLHAYRGNAQHISNYIKRREAIESIVPALSATIRLLDENGISCQTITGAGTGTYPFETKSRLYTELQCGSYVFMDGDYGSILMEDGSLKNDFIHSLFVLTTVMSKPSESTAVCDAGLKAHSVDSGLPLVDDSRPLIYMNASDEHGLLLDKENCLRVGDMLRLIPGHCDPTVNLYDWYVGVRNGHVEAIWPVSARGMVL